MKNETLLKEALEIINKLTSHGYKAYFAGGYARDLLLNIPSDDIDIVTDALPNEILDLFPKTLQVGINFGIVVVIHNHKQFEVATFRKETKYKDGRHPSSVSFTSEEEDAKRRDFTINGMYYNPLTNKIIDYVDGKKDLKKKIVRAIGNASHRFAEDRLRMLRAVRFAARFNFTIEEETFHAIQKYADQLFPSVSIERVSNELIKMASNKSFGLSLKLMLDLHLLKTIFPSLENHSSNEIIKRIEKIEKTPLKTPFIIKLSFLFEEASLEEKINLCKFLKLSNNAIKNISFFHKAYHLFLNDQIDDYFLCHFALSSLANITIDVISTLFDAPKAKNFLKNYEESLIRLKPYIERLANKSPIIDSKFLTKKDIPPGPKMGKMIQEAEKISILEKITDPEELFRRISLNE
ncbi:MAG TPA: CCA tRNA nucleotidyltransferase [Chlamydiales bacterium]|nr:CCA tRNA nucleotidyltransferase [Chlamydiales bacterium]